MFSRSRQLPHSSRCGPSSQRSPARDAGRTGVSGTSSGSVSPHPRNERNELRLVEPRQRQVQVERGEFLHLLFENRQVPLRLVMRPVVHQPERANLLRRKVAGDVDRDFGEPGLARGRPTQMADHDDVERVDHDGLAEAELPQRRSYLGDRFRRPLARVLRVVDGAIDGPELRKQGGFALNDAAYWLILKGRVHLETLNRGRGKPYRNDHFGSELDTNAANGRKTRLLADRWFQLINWAGSLQPGSFGWFSGNEDWGPRKRTPFVSRTKTESKAPPSYQGFTCWRGRCARRLPA